MDMLNHTLIMMAWELYEKGVPKIKIAQDLGKHRETIVLWIQGIEEYGLLEFLERISHSHTGCDTRRHIGICFSLLETVSF